MNNLLKHHGMSLEEKAGTLRRSFLKQSRTAEIFQKAGIVILSVVLYPLGMFFLWRNKKFDKQFKIIESVCCFGLWILLIDFAAVKINNIADSDATMENLGKELTIYVNGECVFSSEVRSIITDGHAQISGIGSLWEANEIVNTIKHVEDKRNFLAQNSKNKEIGNPKEPKNPEETEKSKTKDEAKVETSMSESNEKLEEESEVEKNAATTKERQVSKLVFNGTNIIDSTISDMKQYDYITNIAIEVDESKKDINISLQVTSSIDLETAKMAGEDAARYLAFCASIANSYYSTPGSTDIGGVYKTYNLMLYVDDGLKNYDMYGAKVKSANSITWR